MARAKCPDCQGKNLQITVLTRTTFRFKSVKEEHNARWPVHGKLLLTEPENADVEDDEINCVECGAMYSFDEYLESDVEDDEGDDS